MRTPGFFLLLMFLACQPVADQSIDVAALREEVKATELAFAEMAMKQGVAEAFAHYAAKDVVLSRGKRLIRGKEAMRAYFEEQTLSNVMLNWDPVFIDVSSCGDLAYTYGPYGFSATDTSGVRIEDTGYFHTVWRRQEDGSWKFVWD